MQSLSARSENIKPRVTSFLSSLKLSTWIKQCITHEGNANSQKNIQNKNKWTEAHGIREKIITQ